MNKSLVLASLVAVAGLAACGKKEEPVAPPPPAPVATPAPAPMPAASDAASAPMATPPASAASQ